jgi:endonuclease YncB( thermonuclease family)
VNGIDAPELRQSYGLQSSIEAARLLGYGSKVTLHAIEYDRYGRLVARVTLADGRDFARELVRAGYAWHYVRYSRDRAELAKLSSITGPVPSASFSQTLLIVLRASLSLSVSQLSRSRYLRSSGRTISVYPQR